MDEASVAAPTPTTFDDDAKALGWLVHAAYEMSGQGLNPPVPADFPTGYEIIKNILMKDYGDPKFYGFIAHRTGTDIYAFVIRGTLTTAEWLIDLQSMIPVPFYHFGSVGSGFADTYKTISLAPRTDPTTTRQAETATQIDKRPLAEQVAEAVQAHHAASARSMAATAAPRLWVTGHSLGAALVTLYALERLVYASPPIDKFYTFASPLVGDPTFAAAFATLHLSTAFRIFDDWDPVPYLPPLSGFQAVGTGVEFKLSTSYYYWDPLCSHPMATYLHHFDPSQAPAPACESLFKAAEARSAAMPAKATGATVVQGATTVTIKIQPG